MHFHNDYVYSFGFAFKSEEKVMTKRIVAIGLLLIIVISFQCFAEAETNLILNVNGYKQTTSVSCGAASSLMILYYKGCRDALVKDGITNDKQYFDKYRNRPDSEGLGMSMDNIQDGLNTYLGAGTYIQDWWAESPDELVTLVAGSLKQDYPVVASVNWYGGHYVVIYGIKYSNGATYFLIKDPVKSAGTVITKEIVDFYNSMPYPSWNINYYPIIYKKWVSVYRVSLDYNQINLNVLESRQLNLSIYPSNATNPKVTWTSDNESVASVDNTGVVTANRIGKATITVKTDDGGYTASCTVTVRAPDSGTCGDNAVWSYQDGTLTISGSGAMYDYPKELDGELPIRPWDGYLSEIQSIVVGEGITRIGDDAFSSCNGLNTLSLPKTLKSIGKYAFYACTPLTAINLPKGIISIEDWAFGWCSLNRMSITIPSSITNLGEAVFYGDWIESFNVDSGNNSYTSVNGVLFNKAKTELIAFPQARKGTYIVPSGTEVIGSYAFSYCFFSEIILPETVKYIRDYAFSWLGYDPKIFLPESVISLGDNVFYGEESGTVYCYAGSVSHAYVQENNISYK